MKKLLIGLTSCFFLVLLGCARPIAAPNCTQQFARCKQTCEDNCPNCVNKSIIAATRSYNKYVHEQEIQGGMVIQELKSYRDPLQCRKISCSCIADYNVCLQGMSGIINKSLRINTACER